MIWQLFMCDGEWLAGAPQAGVLVEQAAHWGGPADVTAEPAAR